MNPRLPARLLVLLAASTSTLFAETATDRRFHVSGGAISGSDPIVLTPEGEKVAFTVSLPLPEARFTPDPYIGRCRFEAVKYTLKTGDQREILGPSATIPDPGDEDALVLHPFELRNAAPKFGANAVYLLLSDSEDLKNEKGLHDCAIVDREGDRYRGESLHEIACKTEQGATVRFSRYAGRASFYSCGEPRSGPAKKKK
jgi:hypothetical protein